MHEHLHALGIHAYYAGELDAGRRACERLLNLPGLPPEIDKQGRANRTWYTQSLAGIAGGQLQVERIACEPAHPGWSCFNPTIAADGDRLLAIVRSSNYRIVDGRYVIPKEDAGVIKTEMTRYLWENPEHSERAAERVALKRLGLPEDVARAALFFSTEDSGFTTGTELPVDGGFSWR